jgi:hypothetical protein
MTQKFDGVYDYTKPWRAPVEPDKGSQEVLLSRTMGI